MRRIRFSARSGRTRSVRPVFGFSFGGCAPKPRRWLRPQTPGGLAWRSQVPPGRFAGYALRFCWGRAPAPRRGLRPRTPRGLRPQARWGLRPDPRGAVPPHPAGGRGGCAPRLPGG
ncbi:hypothetical protein GCM10009753_21000 [Streptantibioticus ferralitis]